MSNGSSGIATNTGNQTPGQYLRYSGGGESLARRQQRTGHWREAQAFLELSEKAKALERGAAKDPRKKVPTTEDLIRIVEHESSLRLKAPLLTSSNAVQESYMLHNTDKLGKLPN